jgi:hypothetical protein
MITIGNAWFVDRIEAMPECESVIWEHEGCETCDGTGRGIRCAVCHAPHFRTRGVRAVKGPRLLPRLVCASPECVAEALELHGMPCLKGGVR